jgi:hypothetical protein
VNPFGIVAIIPALVRQSENDNDSDLSPLGPLVLQSVHLRSTFEEVLMSRKLKKLRGTVQKIIKPIAQSQPEKAQIEINGADDLYREIRIENVVIDEKGEKAKLKEGAEVDVTVEADSSATLKKPDNP